MYILKKIWYIQASGYRDPYIPSYGLFDPLGTLKKWLEVVPHLGTDFKTLGTFLRKFGAFNSRVIGTPISFSIVHLFL